MKKILLFLIASIILSSCLTDTIGKIKRVGKAPDFANIELPSGEQDEEEQERYQALYEQSHAYQKKTNSLWQPGSTTFFRDSRAWRVGDIISIQVKIQDNASLNNSTQQKRDGKDSFGITSLFGREKTLAKVLKRDVNPAKLVDTNGSATHSGSGNISRTEVINTEIAAVVTKVLPNGNLVVQGHQEVRVNSELREVKIAGIIRPKDISSQNSVSISQIAEARVSYGGRGVVSDVQQPKAGAQVLDIISPF